VQHAADQYINGHFTPTTLNQLNYANLATSKQGNVCAQPRDVTVVMTSLHCLPQQLSSVASAIRVHIYNATLSLVASQMWCGHNSSRCGNGIIVIVIIIIYSLWNSLPAHVRQTDINFEQFKRQLKTFSFGRWERFALWLLLKCAF